MSYKSFGEHLRTLRVEAGLTLKNVSELTAIDTSLLAKIERNERPPSRQFIRRIAEFFAICEDELYANYLSDLIAYRIVDGNAGLDVLRLAEAKVLYLKSFMNEKSN
jgi:transcriptional regulator with XRE-family HTH domain